jgi:carbamoyltransferase
MSDAFLGIFEGGFDPAVGLARDGKLLAFAEEERFLRNKHAKGFYPIKSLKFSLEYAGLRPQDIAAIGINWDIPSYTDGSIANFFAGMRKQWNVDERTLGWQSWINRYYTEENVRDRHAMAWRLAFGNTTLPPLYSLPHHYVHALQAYMQSPFDDALCITIDGSGDQHCTVLWHCERDDIKAIHEIKMPHSLGWFYAACTEYLGFEAYDGEYKVMGLAAYGKPNRDISARVAKVIAAAADGIGYTIDPSYIHYGKHSWSNRFTDRLPELMGKLPRSDTSPLEEWHYDFAYAVQAALEEAAIRMVEWGAKTTSSSNLCIGGGVGLNVKLNTRLFDAAGIARVFPHPLCSDSGAAAGVALATSWQLGGARPEKLKTLALGNEETESQIESALTRCRIAFDRPSDIAAEVARELADGSVVGWFQGRMEAGPRALGQRSILADPRNVASRDRVNEVIKYRENWRPFCPSMTKESASRYLESYDDAPFMIIAFRANEKMKMDAPAVVHVDGTVRVQMVDEGSNPLYHRLLRAFEDLTGVPILLNTSFNVKGEPIVCSAVDAIRTFAATGMDVLAIGPFIVRKDSGLFRSKE